jgi:hypothetical protein
MSARPGQIIVGDFVLTPSGREARVYGETPEGRLELEYVNKTHDHDEVELPERMCSLLYRPRKRGPR